MKTETFVFSNSNFEKTADAKTASRECLTATEMESSIFNASKIMLVDDGDGKMESFLRL